MRVIIAGSRGLLLSPHAIDEALAEAHWVPDCVVSGGAVGPDRCGEAWAGPRHMAIIRFIPDWRRYGKRAGILRNYEMAAFADALLAFWDGKSNGTRHMIHAMTLLEKPVKVVMMRLMQRERNNDGGA